MTIAAAPVAVTAAEMKFTSGPARVTLIELYTSEGCSSCPPAEKWLGELRPSPGLWKEFVPVALHVNYWDHLGWRDVLASKAFTEREHDYAALWRANSVYTPCFARNGREWQPGRAADAAERAAADAGTLALQWDAATGRCTVNYAQPGGVKPARALDVAVALLGGGIVSNVRKGENAGRVLAHEFVALRFVTQPLQRSAAGTWSTSLPVPSRDDVTASRHAITAWVSVNGDPTPLQAVGGWLE